MKFFDKNLLFGFLCCTFAPMYLNPEDEPMDNDIPICCGQQMEFWDSGDGWEAWKCEVCGNTISDEPDPDIYRE